MMIIIYNILFYN